MLEGTATRGAPPTALLVSVNGWSTPFCLTIDHQSLEDRTITLRDRDSLAQERLPIEGIAEEVERRVNVPWKTPKLG